MKIKTSITISDYIIQEMDSLIKKSESRSSFIEQALMKYIQYYKKLERDKNDLELINKNADALNQEADDILFFQVEV